MGNKSLTQKIQKLEENTQKFVKNETINEICLKTFFYEDEIFSLLKRFELLLPNDEFFINIKMLKTLREFQFNPYTNLILNSIDIYKLIHTNLNASHPKRNLFDIKVTTNDNYESESKNNSDQEVHNSKEYKNILKIEDDNFVSNCEYVIDFQLFCIIINQLNRKQNLDYKLYLVFQIFDINKDKLVCFRDLKNYFTIVFKSENIENKSSIIENYAMNVLKEFKNDKNYKIDFNNFQKILWSSNFLENLCITP